MSQGITIERVDHIGIRVRDLDRALAFYRILGFALSHQATGDDVAIIRNEAKVEINLIFNANAGDPAKNILMDVGEKYAGYTHVALRVASVPATIAALEANGITITQGPVKFGGLGFRPRSRPQRDRAPRPRPGRGRGRDALRAVIARWSASQVE